MKRRLFCITLTLLMCASRAALAQPVGVSYFALQGYSQEQCAAALSVFEGVAQPAVAILWGTFGTDTACLKKFFEMAAGRPHILEIHLTNQTCLRNLNCLEGEVLPQGRVHQFNRLLKAGEPALASALQERVREITSFLAAHRKGNTTVLISTGLEHNYSGAAEAEIQTLLKEAQKLTPFFIVTNPVRGLPAGGIADYFEMHDFSPEVPAGWQGRCIVNNDGRDITFNGAPQKKGAMEVARVPEALRSALARRCIAFLWWSGPQGRNEMPGESPLPPRERNFLLTAGELREANRLLRLFQ